MKWNVLYIDQNHNKSSQEQSTHDHRNENSLHECAYTNYREKRYLEVESKEMSYAYFQ